MTPTTDRVALVTGASSGIGEAAARQLRDAGFTVYAAARRVDRMAPLEADGIRVIDLDVTDEGSARRCVETIEREQGRLDVLVNNAGYGSYGAIEDVPLEEAQRQFDVNVFGAARLIQLVLPGMRERHEGRIINISSMGGKIHTPFGGWYHATKFALEGLSDCLRVETADFGIHVVVVEPGAIRTEWSGIAADSLESASGSGAYATAATAAAHGLRAQYARRGLTEPSAIGEVVVRAATARRPRTRYVRGTFARPALIAHHLLPDRAFDAIIGRAFAATTSRA